MADLFISYSRRDQQFVRDLVDGLSARGKECWVDWKGIPPTAEWIQEIHAGIEGSDAFVFVITPESAQSSICREELEHAEKLNKRIVPVLRRNVDGTQLPDAIVSLNWIPLSESADLNEAIDRMVEAIELDLDRVHRHTRWLEKALEWQKGERDESLLLRGAELRAAEDWLAGAAGREPVPTPLHYEYVQASRAAATRRQRLLLGALAAGIAVALCLALIAVIQRNREVEARKTAESRLVASDAMAHLDKELDLGASLAVAAYRIKETSEARDSLLVAMRRSDHLLALLSPGCGNVRVVRFSPGGSMLGAGCDDGTVVVWEPRGRRTIARMQGNRSSIRALVFSSDGTLVATTDEKRLVEVWRVGGRRNEQPVAVPPGLRADAVEFAPDGRLVLGTAEGVVAWRPGGRLQRVARLRFPVEKLAVAGDGTIAAGGQYGVTVLISRTELPPLLVPVGGDEVVQDLEFAPIGRRLGIVQGQQVFLWESTGKEPDRLPVVDATAIALGRGGHVAAGTLGGDIVLLDREGRRRQPVFRLRRKIPVTSVAFDRTRNFVASASSGRIALWNAGPSRLQASLAMPLEALDALVVTGPRSLLAGGEGRVVQQTVAPASRKMLSDAPRGYISLSSSRDGKVVAAGGSRAVVIWTSGRRQRLLRRRKTPVAVAVSADGATVAEATQYGALDLWDWELRRKPPDVEQLSTGPLKTVAAAPSGSRFAVGAGDGSVWLVDAAAHRKDQVGKLTDGSLQTVAFAGSGGRVAAAATDGTVTIWDVHSDYRRIFRAGGAVLTSVAVDPKGATIAAGDGTGNVFLWDANRGGELGPALAFGGEIQSVDFDPSGRTLGIGLHGGTVILVGREAWDVEAAIESLCERLARC